MSNVPRFGLAALKVRAGQRTFDFRVFDNPPGRRAALEILGGKTYPLGFRGGLNLGEVQTIVDVGANVGAAAIFFHSQFPNARVLAVEPDAETYAVLERNTQGFDRIEAFHLGLFDEDRQAALFTSKIDPMTNSIGSSAHNTTDSKPAELRAALPFLRAQNVERVDLLKVDTEGCERQILGSLSPLLESIALVYLEYHSEEDRVAIDRTLSATHLLCHAKVLHAHRGELCYVLKRCMPDHETYRIRV